MAITPLPTPPARTDAPDVFIANAEAFMAALPAFATEANAVAAAMNLNSTTDTSASSVLVGIGSKTFAVSTNKSFVAGMWLVIADSVAPTTNYMVAQVDSYSSGTGALVCTSAATGGSGTYSSWTISQSAAPLSSGVTLNTMVSKTSDTGSAILPSGNTAQRDGTPAAGYTRFNSDYNKTEVFNGSSWTGLGGANGNGGDAVFYENDQVVTSDYTIAANKNAMSAGPITVNTGVTVTIESGAVWTIV